MSDVKPALTPEELAVCQVQINDRGAWVDGAGADWLGHDDTESIRWKDRRHALAALALHGQTFGFTRADVDALEEAIEEHANALEERRPWDGYMRTRNARHATLRDRIAALLPPRTEQDAG